MNALRWALLRQSLRESLWFFPATAVVAALAAGFALASVTGPRTGRLEWLLYSGDVDSARTHLATLLAALVTVTGVVLSITVVALQIASQQFSPRLLRRFLQDTGTQVSISILLGAFGYLLATLQALPPTGSPTPRLAVSIGLSLGLVSLGTLVYFIHDITRGIRVEAIMLGIERETAHEIRRIYPQANGGPAEDLPDPPSDATPLLARRSGYLQAVDLGGLVTAAGEHGVVVRLRPKVGQHIAQGALLGWAWPPADADHLADRVDDALQLGFERTMDQDVAFGFGQLVDMAVKALSPAVNDPRTSIEATHHLAVLLCTLGSRRLDGLVGRDDEGMVRAVVERPSFADYLGLACQQIRRYGAGEPTVLTSLLEMLGDSAGSVDARHAQALLEQVALIEEAAAQRMTQAADVAEVRRAAAEARRFITALCGPVPSAHVPQTR